MNPQIDDPSDPFVNSEVARLWDEPEELDVLTEAEQLLVAGTPDAEGPMECLDGGYDHVRVWYRKRVRGPRAGTTHATYVELSGGAGQCGARARHPGRVRLGDCVEIYLRALRI